MQIKKIKQEAKQSLKNNWMGYFLISTLAWVILGPFVFLGFVVGIIPGILIFSLIMYVYVSLSLNILDGNQLGLTMVFNVKYKISKLMGGVLLRLIIGFLLIFPFIIVITLLKESLWSFVLFLIIYIIEVYVSIRMSFTIYLINDYNLGGLDALSKSFALTKGNVKHIIYLYMSFLGWFFLLPITLGILSVWLIPYIQVSFAKLYRTALIEDTLLQSD